MQWISVSSSLSVLEILHLSRLPVAPEGPLGPDMQADVVIMTCLMAGRSRLPTHSMPTHNHQHQRGRLCNALTQAFLTRDMRHLVAVVQTAAAVELMVHDCPALHADPSGLHRLAVLTDALREVLAGK